jgi:hypothetical protein
MREHADLDQLKRQAKELLEAFRAGDPAAAAEIAAHFEGADHETFALHDGRSSWRGLMDFRVGQN